METFVTLADTLVDSFDIIDFLQSLAERCVELLDVSEAGIMLADSNGGLRHAACSSERMRLVELFELQLEEGPCFDAFIQGVPVLSSAPEDLEARWPMFAPHAHDAGLAAAVALPMRLRNQVIGALNLFSSEFRTLTDEDLRLAQAMADIATIGILQERTIRGGRAFSTQLQGALDSRVVIEQAKGTVSERNNISVDEAFGLLRGFARENNRLLAETCREVIDGTLELSSPSRPTQASQSPPADS